VVNQNLGSLTTTARADDTIEQKQALERLSGLKDAASRWSARSGSRVTEEERTFQTFTMIRGAGNLGSQGRRVHAWAAGIALDLVPTIS
jgi:hypothetical protein